jgi:RimJ/RimL family protein N-acetyltransferase
LDHWPLLSLRVVTPYLMLMYPTDVQLDQLAAVAAAGIHDLSWMPFASPWSRKQPPQLQRDVLQYHWLQRARWRPEAWELPMVVIVEGAVVGVQGLAAEHFAVKQTAGTGSWLGRKYQGRGIGKEMRAAIIHLAFTGLGARAVYTSCFADNEASLGVTKTLGYAPNGSRWVDREGEAVLQLHFQLEQDVWERRRRDDIQIVGLDSCREFFGVPSA